MHVAKPTHKPKPKPKPRSKQRAAKPQLTAGP